MTRLLGLGQIGLGEELMALAGVHPALTDLSRTQLRRALKVYTGASAYRKALAKGGPRYGLDWYFSKESKTTRLKSRWMLFPSTSG